MSGGPGAEGSGAKGGARPLRILMVAPQPFFRPRGTPFIVLHRLRALRALGHEVELLTYPFGFDPPLSGVRIRRSARPPLVRDVPIGPSVAKLLLDVPLLRETVRAVREGAWDLLHTHEEAGFWGAWLHEREGIPHILDMHSSLPRQFAAFERFDLGPVVGAFERLERYAIRRATGVITVYPELRDVVEAHGFRGPLVLLENTLDLERPEPDPVRMEGLRERLGIRGRRAIVYTGTLEPYQGMELLVEAAALLHDRVPEARIVGVGGTEEQVGRLRARAERLGVGEGVTFLPAVPPEEVFLLHELAEALVTCRTRGRNTPLKIYQYMRSGRPIVATDIPSHTQVLDAGIAELAPPTPEGIAGAMERVLADPARGEELARRARERVDERYGEARHLAALEGFMGEVTRRIGEPAPAGGVP